MSSEPTAPVATFKSVWLKLEEGGLKVWGLAWDDRGVVTVYPDHLEYHGKSHAFSLWNIRAVDVGKFGDNPAHKWVRIRSIHEGVVSVLLFSAKGSVTGQNKQLEAAVRPLIRPDSSPQETALTTRYLEEERPKTAAKYRNVLIMGAAIAALGVVTVILTARSGATFLLGMGAFWIVFGGALAADALRGRARYKR